MTNLSLVFVFISRFAVFKLPCDAVFSVLCCAATVNLVKSVADSRSSEILLLDS